jgi:hypothetical protein
MKAAARSHHDPRVGGSSPSSGITLLGRFLRFSRPFAAISGVASAPNGPPANPGAQFRWRSADLFGAAPADEIALGRGARFGARRHRPDEDAVTRSLISASLLGLARCRLAGQAVALTRVTRWCNRPRHYMAE